MVASPGICGVILEDLFEAADVKMLTFDQLNLSVKNPEVLRENLVWLVDHGQVVEKEDGYSITREGGRVFENHYVG